MRQHHTTHHAIVSVDETQASPPMIGAVAFGHKDCGRSGEEKVRAKTEEEKDQEDTSIHRAYIAPFVFSLLHPS
jgi:hypothetical protein